MNSAKIAGKIINIAEECSSRSRKDSHYSATIMSLRKREDGQFFKDEIDLLIPKSMEVNLDDYYVVSGKLINVVTPHMNIDVSVLVDDVEEITEEDISSRELNKKTKVSLSGTVNLVFTNEKNFVNFYHCTMNLDNGTTVRVVAWNALARYMLHNIKPNTYIEVHGFINSIPHKSDDELSREILASLVVVAEDDA